MLPKGRPQDLTMAGAFVITLVGYIIAVLAAASIFFRLQVLMGILMGILILLYRIILTLIS